MVIGLLELAQKNVPWSAYPVFRTVEGKRLSMDEFSNLANQKNVIYIEAEESEGTDYSNFNAPVLSLEQAHGAINYIKKMFTELVVDLNSEGTVIEMPENEKFKLSDEEKRFEGFLKFRPQNDDINKYLKSHDERLEDDLFSRLLLDNPDDFSGICEEAKIAEKDFSDLTWRVNYLVERDGVTPCDRRKFIYRGSVITLNLFHPEVKEFVHLSTLNPNLAAHWAMALCLAEKKILSHISPEAREDLLMYDAMTRVRRNQENSPEPADDAEFYVDFMDFMKNCINRPPQGN
ncbi:MAG: hypothetical protein A2161_13280 [Candidatus Schekmanbacteria bacterium RBG_13_48_7]|uniref:Uncharacterized protein n=1 Tax=Candidatus Schekmanbacteria bacterium RBG_13_48_7 TaxID=1817878 RepID=A0A1F7RQR5_9BACT|nr:MAG: hypothetical protein A2161_13280 [Candidatus Schekmanbacteria bacterium RBG_13_48_7]